MGTNIAKIAVVSAASLGGVWLAFQVAPLSFGGDSSGQTKQSYERLLDLIPDSLTNKVTAQLDTVKSTVTSQVAMRVAVGIIVGTTLAVVFYG